MTAPNFAANSIVAFATAVILSLLYWQVVRPALVLRLQYKLYAIRDAMRRKVLDGAIRRGSFEYNYLEDFVNKSIVVFPTISFLNMISTHGDVPDRVKNFNRDASAESKTFRDQIADVATEIILMNSPLVFAVCAALAAGCMMKSATAKIGRKTEKYAAFLPSSVGFSNEMTLA